MATREKRLAFASVTDVTFAPLTPEDIAYYVDHYRPFDKAGAYGIQEWIGFVGVERIEGSYYNVMGLPVKRVYEMLQQF
jgi:septum formation protein